MQRPLIIGAGAGLVSATLFASAATATALAGFLFYLSPLPLCLAGLGWGSKSSLVAALAGMAVIAAGLSPGIAVTFAIAIAAPTAFFTHLLLLSRPAATAEGTRAVEWYPISRFVTWAALIAGLLAAVFVLVLGYDQESYRESLRQMIEHSALKEFDRDGTLLTEENVANLANMLARALPAAFAIAWLSMMLFNLWIAGLIVDASGRALRPWPDLHALDLPNALVVLFAVALAASFLPGLPGLMATGFAGALLFAYVLQGLAVIHVYSQGMPMRGLLLATVYLGILLLGWVALLVAILGLAEPLLGLRQRTSPRGQPPSSGIV
ncbi:MAG TPA: DUF2232 domain-containing protein [Methyloceanibacter sp.]|nr:DUF2232 domain-containing protein [Methyloceanibacter sp.]